MIIIALFGLVGWYKGLIKIVMSLAAMLVTIVVCVFLTPAISNYAKNHTQIYEKLNRSIYELIIDNDTFNQIIDENINQEESLQADDIDFSRIDEYNDTILNYLKLIVDKMQFPESIAQRAEQIIIPEGMLQIVDTKSINDIMAAIISARLASLALNAIVYVAAFIFVFLVLRILLMVTGIIEKLPVIKDVNKFLGLLLGVVEGLIVVWLLFAFITACSRFSWASEALVEIGKSGLLSFMYNHNLIMNTLFRIN